eukprot:9494067-Pyramimonas_sp.AAC.1
MELEPDLDPVGAVRQRRGEGNAPQPNSGLPEGPRTHDDIFKFAEHLVERLGTVFAEAGDPKYYDTLDERLYLLEGWSVVLTTSYSGVGSAEWAAAFLREALRKKGFWLNFEIYSATEISPGCRDVLKKHADSPAHIFENILDRIPP